LLISFAIFYHQGMKSEKKLNSNHPIEFEYIWKYLFKMFAKQIITE